MLVDCLNRRAASSQHCGAESAVGIAPVLARAMGAMPTTGVNDLRDIGYFERDAAELDATCFKGSRLFVHPRVEIPVGDLLELHIEQVEVTSSLPVLFAAPLAHWSMIFTLRGRTRVALELGLCDGKPFASLGPPPAAAYLIADSGRLRKTMRVPVQFAVNYLYVNDDYRLASSNCQNFCKAVLKHIGLELEGASLAGQWVLGSGVTG